MKDWLSRLINSTSVEREVEEELRLHLDLLTEKYIACGSSRTEAQGFAARRFGNVDQIRNQCLEISMRNSPQTRALKSFLILVFLTGVLVSSRQSTFAAQSIAELSSSSTTGAGG